MTITIKEYSWYQTPKAFHVTMKCPIFFSAKNVDIFHSDLYVKVSHPPYIFELFFEQKLKVSETRCVIKGTSIDFEFFKEEENLWKDLNIFNFELRYRFFTHFMKAMSYDRLMMTSLYFENDRTFASKS